MSEARWHTYCVARLHHGKWPHWQKVHLSIFLLNILWDCSMCGQLSHSQEELLSSSNSLIRIEAHMHTDRKTHTEVQTQTHTCTHAVIYSNTYFWFVRVCVPGGDLVVSCVHLSLCQSVFRASFSVTDQISQSNMQDAVTKLYTRSWDQNESSVPRRNTNTFLEFAEED